MKTLLVLTDFSEAATHAAKYAAILAKQLKAARILLFNKLQSITSIPSSPLVVNKSHEAKEEALTHLKRLANELKFLKHTDTELIYLAKAGNLDDLTNDLVNKHQVDYVVMGLTGKSKLEQTLIGSNTIQIAKTVSRPLLIIPESAKLLPITKIASVMDLVDTKQAQTISNLLNPLYLYNQLELYVLSHEGEGLPLQTLHNHNFTAVKDKLNRYNPKYYSISEIDIVKEVLAFAKSHNISLIVHIEKKRNFFESLFLTDITERMAYVTHIPLLLVKQ
ncbi:universal stress protein [Olivibacter sp. XZL3]|uniref:universal stress protein n=1 Tax=Olivibacter sp. XZL3 TaxID=1735116 RepID=UPI0014170751|nr:universal stress protein [Olivibacter sp. XZL3]